MIRPLATAGITLCLTATLLHADPQDQQCKTSGPIAHAAAALPQLRLTDSPNNLGFYKPNSKEIPAAVRKASESVVMIATPAGMRTTAGAIFTDLKTIEQAIARVKQKAGEKLITRRTADVYLHQLQACV